MSSSENVILIETSLIKYGDGINLSFAHFQISKLERFYFYECVYRIRVFIPCTPDIDRNLVTMQT